jgi:pimeloyl-ACP methyl ester carboxylesterase
MTTQTDSPREEQLYCLELNISSPTTIVLIHGLFSSHIEWEYVTPHLQDYHLLVIDSAGHSKSSHLLPATIPAAADHVAALIRSRAHNGRAHVVGMSTGGFIAQNLAHRHPSLILSAMASGSCPWEGGAKYLGSRPSLFWYLLYPMDVMPYSVYIWLTKKMGLLPHEELHAEVLRNKRWEVTRDMVSSIVESGWEDVRGVKGVRTLAVAGANPAKSDDVEGARKMGTIWKENGQDMNKVVVIDEAVHAWDLQLPELFAKVIAAWVENKPLPEECKEQ